VTDARAAPFAPGSVSLRLYPHNELPATEVVDELRAQAALAEEVGFAGVMVSEHHGGFAGYLPNPVQTAAFLLDATRRVWVAPCPVLLPLRATALVAEEVAWLAARHPARVGVGVAAGALALDFEVMGLDPAVAVPRFKAEVGRLVAMLHGEELGQLAADPALAQCAVHPVPVLSAAVSPAAARRAASVGAGILVESMSTVERQRAVCDVFAASGGTGSRVAIRRVWLGPPPQRAIDAQRAVYESYAPDAAQRHWADTNTLMADDPAELAARVSASLRAANADACNLRVHMPGVPADAVRAQIERLGREVIPLVSM
jgi:alkanesulfonate monooxygenase SsuD/methylene tetrahydromethanopterin reductase-like flavin-dependent oxidoreductase (luciferase family)